MIGKTVAVLLCVETKKSTWKKPTTEHERKQENFINFISANGGIAFFLNNPDDLKKKIDERKNKV
jgi:hypothetical protein